ncbi:hypothetical protein NEDG_01253 [Nematocida displodere]|uniref:RING-type domain-containing protein n=1 Tax=Nematocida displodere TaxID=1805483 RepID=A0A177ECR2_9MICR|nr:hypothetical protein NEDG_01253 [Nematocida displodere]
MHLLSELTACTRTLTIILILLESLSASPFCSPWVDPAVIYLGSPYTKQTLAFFRVSGYELPTEKRAGEVRLAKNTKISQLEIRLDRYTLETMPEHMVQGLVFDSVTLQYKETSTTMQKPLSKELVAKFFRALDGLHMSALYLDNLSIPGLERGTLWGKKTGKLLDLDTRKYATKASLPSIHTKKITIQHMSDASITEVLSCFNADMSLNVLGIYIRNAPELTTLRCLDSFNPKGGISVLSVDNTANLASIDCALLSSNKVRDVFQLQRTNRKLYLSPEMLQAITSKHWKTLVLPLEIWECVAKRTNESFVVDDLTIDCDCVKNFDALWNIKYRAKQSVKRLTLTIPPKNTSKPTSNKSLKEILTMIDSCFVDVEEVELDFVIREIRGFETRSICVEPRLPKLKCLLSTQAFGCLYVFNPTRSILWIAPNAYSDWASGKLNDEMKTVSASQILFIYGPTRTPFLPATYATKNPSCFKCNKTVDDFNGLDEKSKPKYLGIFCNSGHMACITCIRLLPLEKWGTDDTHSCPICNTGVAVSLSSTLTIEKNNNRISRFVVLWLLIK